jgi:hypothetical protein
VAPFSLDTIENLFTFFQHQLPIIFAQLLLPMQIT